MPGGLMQLVAYGSQDLYLTGNPQMTYFKLVYRRHTNFATEYIRLPFETLPAFSTTQKARAKIKISRHADLVNDTYLVIDMPEIYGEPISGFKWVDYLGFNLINYVTLTIGSTEIDKHYGQWLTIWNELILTDEKKKDLYKMINSPEYTPYNDSAHEWTNTDGINGDKKVLLLRKKRLYIPLMFWFCINPGLSIPLISLQYNEVFINFEFNSLNELFTVSSFNLSPGIYFSTTGNSILAQPEPILLEENLYQQTLNTAGYDVSNLLFYFITSEGTQNMLAWVPNPNVEANYIYLDEDERRMFSKYTQEYLITQVQYRDYKGLKGGPNNLDVKLLHPVKELIWTVSQNDKEYFNDHNNYTYITTRNRYNGHQYLNNNKIMFDTSANNNAYLHQSVNYNNAVNSLITTVMQQDNNSITDETLNIFQYGKFVFNGKDRFREKDFSFFENLETKRHHTGRSKVEGIYTYSFAFDPEKDQPSGTCNFSRIDKFDFRLTLKLNYHFLESDSTLVHIPSLNIPTIYNDHNHAYAEPGITAVIDTERLYNMDMFAINYNVLRIMGGMGSIAFAN